MGEEEHCTNCSAKKMKMCAARSVFTRIRPGQSAFLICDIQEKFRNQIKYYPEIVKVSRRLIDGAKILDMKVLATEQYPKGLGHLVPELGIQEYNIPVYEKTKFSMCIPDLTKELTSDIKSIVLCGIEAHVCIFHTTLDLLDKGYAVHVVVDAVSSRSMTDRIFAFKQLERAGAILTTSECVLLGLVGGSDHPKFKEIQKLIIESAPDTGLLTHVSHI
uniref:Isochorismatase domain-containing protein 1 n=1 Tax=Acrobeloides nanus TaxID=290746 RepID=A0A914CAE3_9BILA